MTSFSRPFRLERRSVAFLDFLFFFDFLFFLMILRFVPSWFFSRFLGSHVSEELHESSTYFRFILRLALFECSLLASEEHEEEPEVSFSLALGLFGRISTAIIIFIIGWFIRHFPTRSLVRARTARFWPAGTNQKRKLAHVACFC